MEDFLCRHLEQDEEDEEEKEEEEEDEEEEEEEHCRYILVFHFFQTVLCRIRTSWATVYISTHP